MRRGSRHFPRLLPLRQQRDTALSFSNALLTVFIGTMEGAASYKMAGQPSANNPGSNADGVECCHVLRGLERFTYTCLPLTTTGPWAELNDVITEPRMFRMQAFHERGVEPPRVVRSGPKQRTGYRQRQGVGCTGKVPGTSPQPGWTLN